MHELILYSGTVFMGFFAIMNPFANTPVFLGLTSEDDPATRKAVAAKGLLFVSGEKLIKYVGENAVNVVTKMMGLILAVIGVQMLIQGIHGAIQAYK